MRPNVCKQIFTYIYCKNIRLHNMYFLTDIMHTFLFNYFNCATPHKLFKCKRYDSSVSFNTIRKTWTSTYKTSTVTLHPIYLVSLHFALFKRCVGDVMWFTNTRLKCLSCYRRPIYYQQGLTLCSSSLHTKHTRSQHRTGSMKTYENKPLKWSSHSMAANGFCELWFKGSSSERIILWVGALTKVK